MASSTRTLTVNLVGRDKDLQKAFKRVSKGSSLMSDKLARATRVAGFGFSALAGAAVGAAAALKPMIDKAADVQESLSKNNVVFGDAAASVEKFAETSLVSFGVSRNAALEATGVFGTLGRAVGLADAESAEMATTLVGLAGDMASFNNASPEETLIALQAGLRGEAEPLRRFGVLLDAATLKSKALAAGIIKNTKEALTPQQKALAAYRLILEQAAIQMGDFERTSDGATNQQRILAGSMEELATEIGATFLPAFTKMVTSLSEEVLPAVREFFKDPSWYEAGRLAGRVAGSGLLDGFTGELTKDNIEKAIRPKTWDELAENELWGVRGARIVWNLFNGMISGIDESNAARFEREFNAWLKEVGTLAGTNFFDVVTNEVGAVNPDWDRGEDSDFYKNWKDAGSAAVGAFNDGVAGGVVVPSPPRTTGPPGSPPDPVAPPEMVPRPPGWEPPGLPEGSRPPPGSGHPAGPGPGFVPGGGMTPPGLNPKKGRYSEFQMPVVASGDDLDAFYASLGITPTLPPGGSGHPAAPTSVVVNVSGVVSGQEVVDAIGDHVDLNGPLPASWTV